MASSRSTRPRRYNKGVAHGGLLAVVRVPVGAEARLKAAKATGLALADLNRRLAGTLPRVLMSGVSEAQASEVSEALESLGFLVVTCDPQTVPGDDERVIARGLEFADRALVVADAQGNTHTCEPRAIALFLQGVRASRTSTKVTTSERRFTPGRALLSGGLLLTRKVEKTTVKTGEHPEWFVLVQRNDGGPDIIIYERRIDYRFLGAEMLPSSRGNLELVCTRLRGLAPGVVTDDRLGQPGFVSGLPGIRADPVDLALLLVTLARLKERAVGA
jgi:hypothetical protein